MGGVNWPQADLDAHYARLRGESTTAAAPVRRNKYNVAEAPGRTVDGIVFASAKEAEAYKKLKILADAGAITELKLQPEFVLQAGFYKGGKVYRPVKYRADFSFLENGKLRIVDTKGCRTAMFILKRKWFEKLNPALSIEEW